MSTSAPATDPFAYGAGSPLTTQEVPGEEQTTVPFQQDQAGLQSSVPTAPPPPDVEVPSPEAVPPAQPPSPPQAPPAAPAPEPEDQVEIITPSAEHREQRIGDQLYVQKPLSYFRKMQFFKLLAQGLKTVLEDGGEDAMQDLLGSDPNSLALELGMVTTGDFDDAGKFVKFVIAVTDYAPDVLEEAYVLWLGVPPQHRAWAKAAMRGDIPSVDALSDEDGQAILQTFIVQNWAAMQSFFGQFRTLGELVAQQRKAGADSGE